MLPAEFRLKINQTRSLRWRDKKEIYTPLFKIVFRISGGAEVNPKIGFIVPGKIKGAVIRNRVRRLLTEAVRDRISQFPKNSEAIIIASSRATEAKYEEISRWFDKALPKLNIPSR